MPELLHVPEYEKLGAFYLGKRFDPESRRLSDDVVLYDAKDLTTHAVCVGMTGSGKTGLCLALLEEAAIDNIPVICIDPKGDLGNLLLTFPQLRPADFRPWLDPQEAVRQGCSVDEWAQRMAKAWKEGLAAWQQDGARIERLRQAVDLTIYTPGSTHGLPLTVLKSFAAPNAAVRQQPEALREQITTAVNGLLALLGIDADPLRSREHILLAHLLDRAWREGRDVELGTLIREIQQPPFQKIGFMDVESFFPAKDRFELALTLNNLLASPGFQSWLEGESLDIQRLLHTASGQPRVSILSIAHLNDSERMFFVTLLLNEVLSWMRSQSGTSSLRAILYMDEIFGYFPPTSNPPSKQPLLTLMKQARAFGLGVVLATQNPVDLDYKGLSNAGTWFLGRLQTERDKQRVLEGLEGASAAAGKAFDRGRMERILAGLGNRVFLMNNVHDDSPVVFQTRWALSFLRGPLTRDQIGTLMHEKKLAAISAVSIGSRSGSSASVLLPTGARPVLPPNVPELFWADRVPENSGESAVYRPALLGQCRVHYMQASQSVDCWREVAVLFPIDSPQVDLKWDGGEVTWDWDVELLTEPEEPATYAELPAVLCQPKTYVTLGTALKEFVYRTQPLTLWKHAGSKSVSASDESEGEFRVRLAQQLKEQRDLAVEKLRAKYGPKLAALDEQRRKAEQRVEKEAEQSKGQLINTALTLGSSVLGALFGRKLASASNIGRAVTTARAAGRAVSQHADVGRAEENVAAIAAKLEALNAEFEAEVASLTAATAETAIELQEISIPARKSDLTVIRVTLLWRRDAAKNAVG